jgi:phage terminase Nu1 subunit (DNA packaging protein)
MSAVAVKTAGAATVGKKELCEALGWSRPKLDRRLNSDRSFPVVSRGDRGGGWKFDLHQVVAYLNGAPSEVGLPQAVDPDEEAPPAPVVLAAVRQQHQGEATARQQRDQADADLKIDRLKRSRGELVEASEMRMVVDTTLVELRSALLAMPDALAQEFGLSERVSYAMKGKVEGMMRTTIQTLRQKLVQDL